MTKAEFESIAAFRYALRKLLRKTEQAARQAGITPQQHQVLLAIKGHRGREGATVTDIANQLQIRQHSAVGLIDRMESQWLVARVHGTVDRRQVFVQLTPTGEAMLARLSKVHRRELQTLREELLVRA
jgi:DNA-binding MarR family transcriptional regulator